MKLKKATKFMLLCGILVFIFPEQAIFAQFSPDPPIDLVDLNGRNYAQSDPQAVVGAYSRNDIYFCWTDLREGMPKIYHTRSMNDGQDLPQPNYRMDPECQTCTQMYPQLMTDKYMGTVYACFQEKDPPQFEEFGIYMMRSENFGLNYEYKVRINDANEESIKPSIGLSDFGRIYAVWTKLGMNSTEIMFDRSTDGGNTFGNDIMVTNDDYSDNNPDIAVYSGFADDQIWAVWERDAGFGSSIAVARSDDSGYTWSQAASVFMSPNNQYDPKIEINGPRFGEPLSIYVTWSEQVSTREAIFVAKSTNGGMSFDLAQPVNENPGAFETGPAAFSVDFDGDPYVFWPERNEPPHLKISGTYSWDHGFVFAPPTFLTPEMFPGDARQTDVYVSLQKYAYIVYQQTGFNPEAPTILFKKSYPPFDDSFNDATFDDWSDYSGIAQSSNQFHDPLGNACQFGVPDKGRLAGLLENTYASQQAGIVDFWFYDGYPGAGYISADFTVTLEQQSPAKEGVVRILGVVNSSDPHTYSVYDGSNYSSTGISRSAGWHRVIIQTSSGGITMLLDAANFPGGQPVYTDTSFTWFDRIAFEGGTETTPYYLDSVRFWLDGSLTVPAISSAGALFLLLALSLTVLYVKRKQISAINPTQ